MRRRSDRGQATPEYVALVLLVAGLIGALLAAGVRIPGTALAAALADRIVCAVGLGSCDGGGESELLLAYGAEVADLVARHTPTLVYEEGMRALPVDFRECREDACAEGPEEGEATGSNEGEPVTVFTRVVDCRDPDVARDGGLDCGGDAAGSVYLQYWLYYPGSQSSRQLYGERGFHPDDWEAT